MKKNVVILLVRGAKQKDSRCQILLIEAFRPLILSKIKQYGYDLGAREDYFSEGVLVLLECVENFDESLGVPFPGYLEKKLFYHFVNVAKRHQNLSSLDAVLPNGDSTILDGLADDSMTIEGDYVHQEDLNALFEYLPRLRERQRWIIEEHYFKKRTFKEIGLRLGVSSNSLVKLHRRAIADLRTHFGMGLTN
ncbi:sigma-70 family RNA polymerase sigma factor [Acetobacterium bakii]|uniref:RNA polymerase sigma-70 region 4 domain-containing protein n=1 Tax=Acetobacterium bakii TaxID=52689 RepID=A0A0L6U1X6_9FIRM|nr:sigma-70 family RNA polymerase sigma factor [Acetobacterium bakii]KNZ42519.1 hypothetical protein AKG39_06245 [Acetobacterium bakii]